MAQNLSPAVMQQRHEAHDSLDHFPTPPWATRALCEWLQQRVPLHLYHAWEPACAEGYMARTLTEYFDRVWATDVHDYGYSGMAETNDFLMFGAQYVDVDWIITNPPFKLGADFIRHALAIAKVGVAMFVRTPFIEGQERYDTLFRDCPETYVLPFTERVVLWKSVMLDPDVPVTRWNAKSEAWETKNPSSATSYCWLVWIKDHDGPTELHRIPPCRKALTRPGDYPPLPDHLRARNGGAPDLLGALEGTS